ncbi:MAG: SAM-dependent methyltransferase [Pseudomonadota bacterium]
MSLPRLTDPDALSRNRIRAARNTPADFLRVEAAEVLAERLIEVNRTFTSPALVTAFPDDFATLAAGGTIVPDTDPLALNPGAHDLVIHAFGLHWADDPLGQIIQARRALCPDGLFLAVLLGGTTLNELRAVLAEAETKLTGGLSPRVAPMADVRDLGGLLQRAGLALPVADTLTLRASYRDIYSLGRDLRAMAEGNALADRQRKPAKRALFELAQSLYQAHFPAEDGRLQATFELVFLTGWAPDDSQPQPLKPGSAQTSLADALRLPDDAPNRSNARGTD